MTLTEEKGLLIEMEASAAFAGQPAITDTTPALSRGNGQDEAKISNEPTNRAGRILDVSRKIIN